jgi:hypothetical protein
LPHKPLPCKSGKTTGCNLLPRYRSHIATTSAKVAMPFPAHKAIIVLPDFVRSLSADVSLLTNILQIKSAKACRKTRARVFARGGKDFSGLMFGYFASR